MSDNPRALAIGLVHTELKRKRDSFDTRCKSAAHHLREANKDEAEARVIEQQIADLEETLHAISDPITFESI